MPTSHERIKKVQEKILQFEESQLSLSETETRRALIDPIFAAIGWDMQNPTVVRMEWRKASGDRPVDYAFMINGVPKLLIEAERLKEDISGSKWRDQLLLYSTQVGVRWCALTNGNIIRIYNSLAEEAAADKLLFEMEIKTIDAPLGLSIGAFMEKLSLLSEESLMDGKIDEVWDDIYAIRKVFDCLRAEKENLIDHITGSTKLTKKSVGGVLDQIIELREGFLERREGICIGRSEFPISVEGIPSEQKDQGPVSPAPPDYLPLFDPNGKPISYKGRRPSSFWFRGLTYSIRSWKDLLVKLCDIVVSENGGQFDKVLQLKGTKRQNGEIRRYFTRDREQLDRPSKISDTDIFVETKIDVPWLTGLLLYEFAYKKEDMKVRIKKW